MRNLWTCSFLLVLCNLAVVQSSINVPAAKKDLQQMFAGSRVPDGMPDWLAVLDDSINILSCLPTIKEGNCYKSKPCRLPDLKFDGKMLPFILKICKDPYLIVLDFLPLDVPWWAKVSLHPFIITFNDNNKDGVFTIKSHTTVKAMVRYVNFGIYKASLFIDGILRYDCTKPTGANSWMKRVNYNLKAPNNQYTSLFYKIKIRIELKKKRFNWFKFDYKCKRCEDLVNEYGTYGGGNPSCADDMERYELERFNEEKNKWSKKPGYNIP